MNQTSDEVSIDRYAVIGNPIAHSKSPDIHLLFADQTGEHITYEKIQVEVGEFESFVNEFFENGGKGLNITVPFKVNAFQFVNECTDYAEHAGAVNTILRKENGNYLGANTDGIGLLRDLKKSQCLQLESKKILIIGAGGATQGIVEPLLDEKPATLVLANRTVSNAKAIAEHFKAFGEIEYCGLHEIPKQGFDLVLHATSAALQSDKLDLPTEIIQAHTCCYDLFYSNSATPFMRWAKNNNANIVVDGFGMLLEQAAEAFYLWRNKRPDTGMAYHYFRPNSKPATL